MGSVAWCMFTVSVKFYYYCIPDWIWIGRFWIRVLPLVGFRYSSTTYACIPGV